jgi:manganese/zinc/iron transport system permease protein
LVDPERQSLHVGTPHDGAHFGAFVLEYEVVMAAGGALAAGAATTLLVDAIHRRSRVKQDSAIGITFTTLFAIGVVLISIYAQQVDLDAECVLYGEIAFVPLEPFATVGGVEIAPPSVLRMAGVLLAVVVLVIVFYKELLVSSFDAGLAASLGINPSLMHYSLMAMLSIVVVSAFEAVGAILVIAMLILPGATSFLLTHRLWKAMLLSVAHAALSTLLGIHLSVWLSCSVAAAMVVMGSVLFVFAWIFAPESGLVARAMHARSGGRRALQPGNPGDPEAETA